MHFDIFDVCCDFCNFKCHRSTWSILNDTMMLTFLSIFKFINQSIGFLEFSMIKSWKYISIHKHDTKIGV